MLASEYGLPLLQIDIQWRAELAEIFRVRSIPTVIGIRDGVVAGALVGGQGRQAYAELAARVAE